MSQENYDVELSDNIFKFKDKNLRNEQKELTVKKSHHDYIIQRALEYLQSIDEKFSIFKLPDNHNDILEIINAIPKDAKEKIYEFAMRKDRDFKSIPQNFPNDISQKEYNRCNQLNEALKNSIKNYYQQNDPRLQNDQFKKLFNDTMDKYGTNPYKDGQIAAQSAHWIISDTGNILIWSVCGLGSWGIGNDTIFADLIATSCKARSMAQIRKNSKKIKIAPISATPDEFSAISAFMSLNAQNTVFIASGENFPKGNYLINIELPILLQNPFISEIKWINTSNNDFLNTIKSNAEKEVNEINKGKPQAKAVKDLQSNCKNLIEKNSKIIFEQKNEISSDNVDGKTQEIIEAITNLEKANLVQHEMQNYNELSEERRNDISKDKTDSQNIKDSLTNISNQLTPAWKKLTQLKKNIPILASQKTCRNNPRNRQLPLTKIKINQILQNNAQNKRAKTPDISTRKKIQINKSKSLKSI